jgi:hypothetical protein
VDLIESIKRFLGRISIYTQVPRTPALDEMVVRIVIELLTTLALATKGLKQRQTSQSILDDVLLYSLGCSDMYKETFWREGC